MNEYIELKLITLPRINFAVLSKIKRNKHEEVNNPYNAIIYVDSGVVRVRFNDEVLEISAGNYWVVPSGTKYELEETIETKIVNTVAFFLDEGTCSICSKEDIKFDVVNNVQFVENEKLFFPMFGKIIPNSNTYILFKKILTYYDNMGEYSNINVSSDVISFFVSLANDNLDNIKYPNLEGNLRIEEYCNRIDQYLNTNYMHIVTMPIIAMYMQMHENYLSSIYHKKRGLTIMQQLLSIRMEKAKQLLATKKYSIKEVASMVGYKNSMHFSTMFKRYEDVSPSKYLHRFYDDKVYSYFTIEEEKIE